MKETANYFLRKPERGTRPDRVDVEDLNYNADIIDGELDRLEAAKTDRTEFEAHRTAAVMDHPNGSVTDAKIGNRIIGAKTGQLSVLLNSLADEIKDIKGAGDWEQQPQTDLAETKAHIDSRNNPHGVTKAQVGLANVNDTADKDKPLSDAAVEALAAKVDTADIVQETGMSATQVMSQKAVTDAIAEIGSGGLDDIIQAVMSAVYPVGSIYMSASATNPSELFGGTWVEWGSGRVPVGVNASDTDFDTVEETGGTKSVTLTAAQSGTPAHNHTFTGNAVNTGIESATHSHHGSSLTAAAGTDNEHNHTLSVDGIRIGVNSGSYSPGYRIQITAGGFASLIKSVNHGGSGSAAWADTNYQHTHSITGNTSTESSNHYHNVTAKGTISNNTAANAASAHNNLQPYITCYMWKRTA